MNIQEWKRLKSKVSKLKSESDKLQGRLSSEMVKLKELGFENEEEANKEISKLNKRKNQLEKELKEAKEGFEEKWKDKL